MTEEIDLANVDYDDVLHLYRGWRKSEGALKEKNKELGTLKGRMKQLQDSHVKFRGQIQALESVKELTISLQTQLSLFQQENIQLQKENRTLAELNQQQADTAHEKSLLEQEQTRILKDIRQEFTALRGKYSELGTSHKNMERFSSDEQAMRMSAEARLQSAEEQNDALRIELKATRSKLETTTVRMAQCDLELAHASDQLRNLSIEVSTISDANRRMTSSDAEIGVLKSDIARLLRLLEHYPAARKFLISWQDSQGMSFVGLKNPHGLPEEEFDILVRLQHV